MSAVYARALPEQSQTGVNNLYDGSASSLPLMVGPVHSCRDKQGAVRASS